MYAEFMSSMEQNFRSFLQSGLIDQIQVGLGPAGELRFPGYQLQFNRWSYCGIGEFQCFDKYLLDNLKAAAQSVGQPQWGTPPNNAGTYNSRPSQTAFFSPGSSRNYASQYGKFFLGWYMDKLVQHGSSILSQAVRIFPSTHVAAKISGIHWWYADNSHAAEVTSGYCNTNFNDAYLQIARMLKRYGVSFDFTALEMRDSSNQCGSQPEELVKQTILASISTNTMYFGENALELCSGGCDQGGFNQILKQSTQYRRIDGFTYLRISDSLLYNPSNWNIFTSFVNRMHNS